MIIVTHFMNIQIFYNSLIIKTISHFMNHFRGKFTHFMNHFCGKITHFMKSRTKNSPLLAGSFGINPLYHPQNTRCHSFCMLASTWLSTRRDKNMRQHFKYVLFYKYVTSPRLIFFLRFPTELFQHVEEIWI